MVSPPDRRHLCAQDSRQTQVNIEMSGQKIRPSSTVDNMNVMKEKEEDKYTSNRCNGNTWCDLTTHSPQRSKL